MFIMRFVKRFSLLFALYLPISATAPLRGASPREPDPGLALPDRGDILVDPDPAAAIEREVFLNELPPGAGSADIADIIGIPRDPGRVLFPPELPHGTVFELDELPIARDIAEEVSDQLADIDIEIALIENLGIMVNDCLGIRASAGTFSLQMPRPSVEVGPDGLDFEFRIDRVSLTTIQLQAKPRFPTSKNPDPCDWGGIFEVSGTARDILLNVHIKPKIQLELCDVVDFGVFDIDFSIGSLDLKPVPGAVDSALRTLIEFSVDKALNFALPGVLRGALKTGVSQFICGNGYLLYLAYMGILGAGVDLYRLPEAYIEELQPLFPHRDLHDVRFGNGARQPRNNATTDCSRIYFNNPGFVERLRSASLASPGEWGWLLHELRHTEQCVEVGGRQEYAEMWFNDLAISVLVTAFTNLSEFFGLIHDNMPMEQDADERAASLVVVRGSLEDSSSDLPEGAILAAVAAGEVMPQATVVARATTRNNGTAYPWDVGYELVLPAGEYDLFAQFPVEVTPAPIPTPRRFPTVEDEAVLADPRFDPPVLRRWTRVHSGLVVSPDADSDGRTDVVQLHLGSSSSPVIGGSVFLRGDADSSGELDISDPLLTLVALFIGGEDFGCEKAADSNDDAVIDLSDSILSLGFLFLGTTPPAAPFPDPGQDPTEDSLGCELSSAAP